MRTFHKKGKVFFLKLFFPVHAPNASSSKMGEPTAAPFSVPLPLKMTLMSFPVSKEQSFKGALSLQVAFAA